MTHPLIEIAREAGFDINDFKRVSGRPYQTISLEGWACTKELTKFYALVEAKVRPQWIPVGTALPPYMHSVLTTDGHQVRLAYLTDRDIQRWSAWPANKVTHWQPLPSPPEQS